ncbi:MAG TPA: hypothetical protein VEY11_18760 [Pyrinomonadaceae bacterium]|nr:hypothetical protein [Pyrinomonadaceae bacterium]
MPHTKSAPFSPRRFALALVALSFLAAAAHAQKAPAPSVSKVEPPSWWAAHTINPVRLCSCAARICTVRASRPGAVRENAVGMITFAVPARTAVAFKVQTLTTVDTHE